MTCPCIIVSLIAALVLIYLLIAFAWMVYTFLVITAEAMFASDMNDVSIFHCMMEGLCWPVAAYVFIRHGGWK